MANCNRCNAPTNPKITTCSRCAHQHGTPQDDPVHGAIERLRSGRLLSGRDMSILATRPQGIVELAKRGYLSGRG